MLHLGKER
jgi:hypothetical protein